MFMWSGSREKYKMKFHLELDCDETLFDHWPEHRFGGMLRHIALLVSNAQLHTLKAGQHFTEHGVVIGKCCIVEDGITCSHLDGFVGEQ